LGVVSLSNCGGKPVEHDCRAIVVGRISFRDADTEYGFNGADTTAARRTCAPATWRIALRKLESLDSDEALVDLRILAGNRFEAHRGDRLGQASIRINAQYRICFVWTAAGPREMEIVNDH
jgi:proteic killer suppression protein